MSDLLDLARSVLGSESSEGSAQSHLPEALPSPSALPSRRLPRRKRRRWVPRIPCATCGLRPTGTFEDGSPRYDHGHDPQTGETWWAKADVLSDGRCPACTGAHPAGTSCPGHAAFGGADLTRIAREIFADVLPDGSAVAEARARHDQTLLAEGVCDMRCGMPRCRGTHIDSWPPTDEPQTGESDLAVGSRPMTASALRDARTSGIDRPGDR